MKGRSNEKFSFLLPSPCRGGATKNSAFCSPLRVGEGQRKIQLFAPLSVSERGWGRGSFLLPSPCRRGVGGEVAFCSPLRVGEGLGERSNFAPLSVSERGWGRGQTILVELTLNIKLQRLKHNTGLSKAF